MVGRKIKNVFFERWVGRVSKFYDYKRLEDIWRCIGCLYNRGSVNDC